MVLLTANLLVILLPLVFKHSTTGAMTSSSQGESCTKPSKDVLRTQSYMQHEAFAKIVNGFQYLSKKAPFEMFDWGLNTFLPSTCKSLRKCNFETNFPNFSISLSLSFFKKVVDLKATSYGNPVSNFKHL